MKFLDLKAGDLLRSGDEYCDPHTGKWHPTMCQGKAVGILGVTTAKYRRPVSAAASAQDGKKEERTP